MAWRAYSTIYLLDGVHTLSSVKLDSSYKKCTDDLSPLSRPSTSSQGQDDGQQATTTTSPITVTVKTALCSDLSISGCASTAATIELTSDKVVLTASSIKLAFSGVKLDGTKSLYTDKCTSGDSCSYCPYTKAVGKGFVQDDRGETYADDEIPIGTGCPDFSKLVFITVDKSGALTMLDVQVNNFRQQFSSIISADDGVVTLQNTDFDNVQSGKDAVISGNCRTKPNLSCVFTYTSGKVTRLNNGYEYRSDLTQHGFLSLTNFYSVALSSLTFSMNTVFGALESMIKIERTTMTTTVTSLTFDTNVAGASLLVFDYSDLKYDQIDVDSQGYSIQDTQTHLTIAGLVLTHNACGYALTLTEAGQNVNAEISLTADINCFSSSALSLVKTTALQTKDFSEASFTYKDGDKKMTIKTKPYTIQVSSVFTASLASNGLINAKSVPVLKLSGCSFADVSEASSYSLMLQDVAIQAFIDNPSIYLKVEAEDQVPKCTGLVTVKSLYSLDVSSSAWSNYYCDQGSPGISIESLSGPVTLTSLTFSSLSSEQTSTAAVKGSANTSSFSITSCTFSSLLIAPVFIESQETFSITGSTFQDNYSYYASGIYVAAITSVKMDNLTFKNMEQIESKVVTIEPAEDLLDITLNALTFSNISSDKSFPCLSISGSKSNLTGSSLKFDGLTGANTAILFEVGTDLTSTSLITGLTITNIQDLAEAILINLASGQLTIEGGSFSANTAQYIIRTYLRGTAKVVISNSSFKSQVGLQAMNFNESADGTLVSTSNCVIADNTARAVNVITARWTDSGSTIQHNSKGGVFSNSGHINLTGTKFLSNTNPEDGGAVQLTYKCTFLCSSCTFTANSASTGGAIRLDQGSVMTVTKSTFTSNSSTAGGSALYIISSNKANSMTDCTLTSNTSLGAGTVSLIESTITITTTSFSRNAVAISGGGLQMNSANLTCTQCSFADHSAPNSAIGQISTNSVASFVSSTFVRASAFRNGGGFVISESTVSFDGCSGSALRALLAGGFVFMSGQR
jgi:hypothetical protein